MLTTFESISALRAATTIGQSFTKCYSAGYYAANDGGGGSYAWFDSLSAADDGGAVIRIGAGGWLRIFDDPAVANPKWWGAKDDSTLAFDSYTAFAAAIAYLNALPKRSGLYNGGLLLIPGGSYRISQALSFTNEIDVRGTGMGYNTVLYFYNAQTPTVPISGLIVQPATGAGVQPYAKISNLKLKGYNDNNGNNSPTTPYYNHVDHLTTGATDTGHAYVAGHAIEATTRVHLDRVNIESWQLDGVHITSTDTTENANVCRIKDCVINNNGRHPFFIQGDNGNACEIDNLDANNNGGHALHDRSFLGNTYVAGQVADNGDFIPNITCLARSKIFTYGVEQTLFAGSSVEGGVFVTADGGTRWQELDLGYQDSGNATLDVAIRNLQTRALVMSSTLNKLFAATRWGCFSLLGPASYYSGNSWSKVSTGLTTVDGLSIDYDETGGKLYYGTNGGGVFLSANAGTSWTAVNTSLGNLTINALACDPANTGTVYAGTASGVYKTTNSGTSWSAMTIGSTVINCLAMISGVIYAGCNDGKIYKCTDGATWNLVFTEGAATPITAVALNAANSAVVLAATNGAGAYVSTNSGSTWTQQNTGLTNVTTSTACLTLGSALVTANGQLYAGGLSSYAFKYAQTGGVFQSSDNGAHWTQVTNQTPHHGGSVRTAHSTAQNVMIGVYKESDQTPQIEPPSMIIGGILGQYVSFQQVASRDFLVPCWGQAGIMGMPDYCVPYTVPKIFQPKSSTTTIAAVNAGVDALIFFDGTNSFGQLTVPAPSSTNDGAHLVVRRIDTTTNACALVAGGGTFDSTGTNQLYLYGQGDWVELVSDYANSVWRVKGRGQAIVKSFTVATLPNPASIAVHKYTVARVTDSTPPKFVYFDGTAWGDLLEYTASTPANWAASTPPTTIKDALDRIAAALTALGHAP